MTILGIAFGNLFSIIINVFVGITVDDFVVARACEHGTFYSFLL